MKLRNVLYVIGGILIAITMVSMGPAGSNTIYLPLVIKNANNDQQTLTSIELIEKDLAAGILDANTAAIYEAYTVLPDSPLPSKYRGATDREADIAPFRSLIELYGSLSPEEKTTADPYLRRPDDPTSAYFQFQQRQSYYKLLHGQSSSGSQASATRPPNTIQWTSLLTTKGVVRIHYRKDIAGDLASAKGVAAEIDAKIYDSLYDMMGHQWLDDTGCVSGGRADNGGGAELDIYLMHGVGYNGLEISCKNPPPTPGWVILDADRSIGGETEIGMVQTASHEIFHTIQDRYAYLKPVGTYLWMQEATAMWVEDHVYPIAQAEQPYAEDYLNDTRTPMDYHPTKDLRSYGEYLWPFYLSRILKKDPSFIRTMFENANSYPSVDIFVQRESSDYPVTLFPNFALNNWNQAPFNDYEKVDSLTQKAKYYQQWNISGLAKKEPKYLTGYFGNYERLSAYYYDLVFGDDTARTVAFYNGLSYKLRDDYGLLDFVDNDSTFYQTTSLDLSQYDGLNVQALMKINDTWTWEDWTNTGSRLFCRDRNAQRLQELVVIITNSNFKDTQANYNFSPVGDFPVVYASPTGCYQWKGTVDMADTSSPGLTNTLNAEVTFEASDPFVGPDVLFNVKQGGAYVTFQGKSSDGNYIYHVAGWANFEASDPYSFLTTYNLVTGGAHPDAYYGYGQDGATVDGTYDYCCDEDGHWVYGEKISVHIGTWFNTPNPVENKWIQSTGDVIEGSYTESNGYISYKWNFTVKPEP